jgi:hypothetical protein
VPRAPARDERRDRLPDGAVLLPCAGCDCYARARATRATFSAIDIVMHWLHHGGGDSAVESHTGSGVHGGRRRGYRPRLGTKTDLGTQPHRKSSQIANFFFLEATDQKSLDCRAFSLVS